MEWHDKSVVLGVTGGVAAFKAVALASKLSQLGAIVDVVMTKAARRFVTPLMFAAVTRREVYTSQWKTERKPDHISLAQRPDLIVVAPATANTLAKIAHGFADNLLTTTILASGKPLLVAPAMNTGMWDAPATRENMAALVGRGVRVVGPGSGYLACGDVGGGRMAEPADIIKAMEDILDDESCQSHS